ncbi:hypothetical protein HELRODRAFT_66057 [Helobdella robusta]|uniref:USP domain-containing protein n=1 Tax=Helobdella robusta TaxID=6412 RepID=T1FYG5_HELRO|nr:hypothetical protein HELRODRAFT_66057 [Helobdella robusta]ESO02268.1 hypothetical protein HELRODRAFT_66057 [Helobdella robusta]
MKGIQGLNNSCYIDASVFCMFAFNSTFDSALHKNNGGKKTGDDDDLLFIKVKMQKCLRDSIVNPLRRDFFVSADKVATLRSLLDQSLTGQRFLFEEKDPEEFMNAVLEDMLNVDPFLKFNTGHESHIHQLFIDKDNLDIDLTLTSVQQLIEISFFQSTLKLTQKPACLMLQMPRHGKEFKMFDVIIPSLFIDVTDLLQYGIRECTICGEMGVFECSHCFHSHKTLSSIVFCQACSKQYHSHNKRSHHQPQSIKTLFINSTPNASSTEKMELFAVMCVDVNHFVSFVKTGSHADSPWIYFDSMVNRKVADNVLIPSIRVCSFLPGLLTTSESKLKSTCLAIKSGETDNELMKRFLSDAYICMYRSTELMFYK